MKAMTAIFTLLLSSILLAAPRTRIEELQLKCEKEKTSLFRENNGTPSCSKLIEAIKRDEYLKEHKDDGYHVWNEGLKQFCYYNALDELVSCP